MIIISLTGEESGKYFLDLKNGSGSCGSGDPKSDPDVTFTLNDKDFQDMFKGKKEELTLYKENVA